MTQIIIKHINGSLTNKTHEFSIENFKEITFGRSPSSTIVYDTAADDVVARNQAKIINDPQNPTHFLIVDLDSRNGTFVNKQRVEGSARIKPTDLVQFGKNGPEFQFDLNPRPVATTRLMPNTRTTATRVEMTSVTAPNRQERIILKHLSGSRCGQTDEFPLTGLNELTFGRDPVSSVVFDPQRDDMVARNQARLLRDTTDPTQFILVDLKSRNGTFVNGQRMTDTARVSVGDRIRFGANGPELELDLDPRPLQKTRVMNGFPNVGSTRVLGSTPSLPSVPEMGATSTSVEPVVPPKQNENANSVSRTGVFRMVEEAKAQARHESHQQIRKNTFRLVITAVLLAVMTTGGIGATLWYNNKQLNSKIAEVTPVPAPIPAPIIQRKGMTPEQVKKVSESVVRIEVSWKLIFTPTGGQLYQEYVPNLRKDETGNDVPIIPNGPKYLPTYMQFSDGVIEPILSLSSNNGINRPISGEGSGTGFVVNDRGFILTNRHVAAGWMSSYHFERIPGLLFAPNGNGQLVPSRILTQLPYWIPSQSRQAGNRLQGGFEGRHDYLYIAFQNSTQRIRATLSQASDKHDVAMIKIEVPNAVPALELLDTYDSVNLGQQISVLGYPGMSPFSWGVVNSQDPFVNGQGKLVDSPSLGSGTISKVLRNEVSKDGKNSSIYSQFGDVYQLATTGVGPGNSGSPVFNEDGKVIAVFFAGSQEDSLTFAVPIRYAMELLGPKPVTN